MHTHPQLPGAVSPPASPTKTRCIDERFQKESRISIHLSSALPAFTILMATRNGAVKFPAQPASAAMQSYTNQWLCLPDDGSTDAAPRRSCRASARW